MKYIVLSIAALLCLNYACKPEQKKAASTQIPGYQEMQQIAIEYEKGLDSLHIYQGAIRDMLHSFEASFPKDTFTTKLRAQLSDLNKAEYIYTEWKKRYMVNWDTLKVDKISFAAMGKSDITSAKEAQLYSIQSSKKLIDLLKRTGIQVMNDPTVKK
jgi:hypothetical protein